MNDNWNKCAECGRFVSYQDILDNKARITFRYFAMGDEHVEVLCPEHNEVNDGRQTKDRATMPIVPQQ